MTGKEQRMSTSKQIRELFLTVVGEENLDQDILSILKKTELNQAVSPDDISSLKIFTDELRADSQGAIDLKELIRSLEIAQNSDALEIYEKYSLSISEAFLFDELTDQIEKLQNLDEESNVPEKVKTSLIDRTVDKILLYMNGILERDLENYKDKPRFYISSYFSFFYNLKTVNNFHSKDNKNITQAGKDVLEEAIKAISNEVGKTDDLDDVLFYNVKLMLAIKSKRVGEEETNSILKIIADKFTKIMQINIESASYEELNNLDFLLHSIEEENSTMPRINAETLKILKEKIRSIEHKRLKEKTAKFTIESFYTLDQFLLKLWGLNKAGQINDLQYGELLKILNPLVLKFIKKEIDINIRIYEEQALAMNTFGDSNINKILTVFNKILSRVNQNYAYILTESDREDLISNVETFTNKKINELEAMIAEKKEQNEKLHNTNRQ